MPKPKCKFCGKPVDKDTAYKTLVGKKTEYFCNEAEHDVWLAELNKEADFLEDVNYLIELYVDIRNDSSWVDIKQTVTTLRKTYTRDEILWYLNNTLDDAVKATGRKTFEREFYMVRYLLTILKNHIAEYLRDHPVPPPVESRVEVDYYMAPIRYKPSNLRRAMSDFERLDLEGDGEDG